MSNARKYEVQVFAPLDSPERIVQIISQSPYPGSDFLYDWLFTLDGVNFDTIKMPSQSGNFSSSGYNHEELLIQSSIVEAFGITCEFHELNEVIWFNDKHFTLQPNPEDVIKRLGLPHVHSPKHLVQVCEDVLIYVDFDRYYDSEETLRVFIGTFDGLQQIDLINYEPEHYILTTEGVLHLERSGNDWIPFHSGAYRPYKVTKLKPSDFDITEVEGIIRIAQKA